MSLPSTEIQRIVLVVLLGIVGYLLVYNWNQDYGQGARSADSVPEPSAEDASFLPPPTMDAPSAGAVRDDIPSDDLVGTADAPSIAAETVDDVATSPRIVSVQTPTLAVSIDRLGGDIVRLDLPRYPRELGSDDGVRLL